MTHAPDPSSNGLQQAVPGTVDLARVAKADPGTERNVPESGSGLRRLIRRPLSLVILIPGLMLAAGCALLLLNRMSLHGESAQHWRDRVNADSLVVATTASRTLAQAPDLLKAVRTASGQVQGMDDLKPLIESLLWARAGVASVIVATTDGRGLRSSFDGTSGSIRWERFTSWGVPTSVAMFQSAPMQAFLASLTGEQPRWSPVSGSLLPDDGGNAVLCGQALGFADPSRSAGIVLIEFDGRSLAPVLKAAVANADDSMPFIFAADGRMLIQRSAPREIGATPDAGPRSFREVMANLPAVGKVHYFDHMPQGLPVLSAVRQIELPGAPVLYASAVAPLIALSASTQQLVVHSFWIEIVAVLLASAVAWVVTRVLSRQQRQVLDARADARATQEKLDAFGSYRLIRRLGAGGMGEIWQAEHHLLARPAALKLISMEGMGTTEKQRENARQRFAREARATASLSSPHTVTVYDFGFTSDGSFFYAMELLDGLDLDHLVTAHGPQHPARVIAILIQICRSLAEAHGHGLIHRDIKPANIYLCRLGTEVDVAKVLDFGLVTDRVTEARAAPSNTVFGTPAFIAPEQAQGLPSDGRTDLYALGAVAYWLISGRTLFTDEDPSVLLGRQVHDQPAPLQRVAKQRVPPELEALIMRLLAKDPADRPRDAQAVISDLEKIPEFEDGWPRGRAKAWWSAHMPPAANPDPALAVARTATLRVMRDIPASFTESAELSSVKR